MFAVLFYVYVMYVLRLSWSCPGVCDRCLSSFAYLSALATLVVLLVVFALFDVFAGFCLFAMRCMCGVFFLVRSWRVV